MKAPLIARIFGMLFLLAAIAGVLKWVAPAAPFDAPVITLTNQYRMLAGIFPVNIAHDAIHAVFGLWGLAAALRFKSAVFYCRSVMWIYLALVVLGAIPITSTLFGFAPIYGWDIALHGATVLVMAYGGYGAGSKVDEEPSAA